METLPTDIQKYIEFLCHQNIHLEHIKSLNEEFKNKFLNKMLPPFLLLKKTFHSSDFIKLYHIHDEYTTFYCQHIEKLT